MSNILKISEAASLGMHAMALLAKDPERLVSTGEIASILEVSEAHLSKVLQRLQRSGYVQSTRGPRGGFSLAKSPSRITLLDIFEALEGPLRPSNCLLHNTVCHEGGCILGGLLETVNKNVKDHLAGTKLSDLNGTYGNS